MHSQILLLIATFAASMTAAPVPVQAHDGSSVERSAPIVARADFDAALSPVLDKMKREILERLESAVPVKRQECQSANGAQKRQDWESTDSAQKRQDWESTDSAQKRQEWQSANSAQKRDGGMGYSQDANDKRRRSSEIPEMF